jgi:hypothetical protein
MKVRLVNMRPVLQNDEVLPNDAAGDHGTACALPALGWL